MSEFKSVDLNRLVGLVDDIIREIKSCKNIDELNSLRIY